MYAVRTHVNRDTPSRMHNLLRPGKRVDHKDGNGLNNQKDNLRDASRSQNRANSGKFAKSLSRFKGVTFDKHGYANPWRARFRKDGVLYQIGNFKDEVDAATAYNFAVEEAFGEFARFNLPIHPSAKFAVPTQTKP